MQKRRTTAPPTKETKKGGNRERKKQRNQKKRGNEATKKRGNEETRQQRNEARKKRGNEETTKRRNKETKKRRNEETKKGRNKEMKETRNEDTKKWGSEEMKEARKLRNEETRQTKKHRDRKKQRNEEMILKENIYAVHCVALWTPTVSQVWTCVKYEPKPQRWMLRPIYHTHTTCLHLWLQTCTWFSSASPPTPLQLLQAKTKPSLFFRTSPAHAVCTCSELSSVIMFFSTKLLPLYLLAAPYRCCF